MRHRTLPAARPRAARLFAALLLVLAPLLLAGSPIAPAQAAPPDPSAPPLPATPSEASYSLKAGGVAPPNISADSWIVADADSGAVLAAKGAHEKRPPASTLKTLTALTVGPRLQPDSVYSATVKDQNQEGSRVGIRAGMQYTVKDLLLGLLLPSGNDAASALANAYRGWPETIAAMNAEAARIGATDTHAENPSGLDKPGQVSSAADLVTIFRELIKNKFMRSLLQVKYADFPAGPDKNGKLKTYAIANQDKLLIDGYPGIIGGKTGYTTNAGRTFVCAAQRNGHTILVSILRSEGATDENAKYLLNWGLTNADNVNAVGHLPTPTPLADPPAPQPARQLDKNGQSLTPVAVADAAPGTAKAAGSVPGGPGAQAEAAASVTAPLELPFGLLGLVVGACVAGGLLVAFAIWRVGARRQNRPTG